MLASVAGSVKSKLSIRRPDFDDIPKTKIKMVLRCGLQSFLGFFKIARFLRLV